MSVEAAVDVVGMVGMVGPCPDGASRPGAGTVAERLTLARGLLRRAEERSTWTRAVLPVEAPGAEGDPARPVDGALPVVAPLAGLFPAAGLRRGSTVAVGAGPGSTSLLLALLAEASVAGAWIGVVGRPELGLVAAAEAGLRLERLALVPHPGADLVAVTAALLDGLDVVVVAGAGRAGVRAADRQRLAARARQRGAVLMPLGRWPGADVELACTDSCWEGLGAGFGRLRTRRAEVRLRGRGLPSTGRGTALLLPAPGGAVGPVAADAGGGAAAGPTANGGAGAGPAGDGGAADASARAANAGGGAAARTGSGGAAAGAGPAVAEPRDGRWPRQVCATGERGLRTAPPSPPAAPPTGPPARVREAV